MWRCGAVGLVLGVLWLFYSPARIESWWLRRQMRREGYALDRTAFGLHLTLERQARYGVISNAVQRCSWARMIPFAAWPMGTNSAWVVWQLSSLPGLTATDPWGLLRREYDSAREPLDGVTQALLEIVSYREPWWLTQERDPGGDIDVAQVLSARISLGLHDHDNAGAWTNLMALTRLALAWSPQPFGAGDRSRLACLSYARDATWSGLQARTWTDAQLAALQREWEQGSRLADLPQVVAATRVRMLEYCGERRVSKRLSDRLRHPDPRLIPPASAWEWFETCFLCYPADFLREGPALVVWNVLGALYPGHGSYRDEAAILRYFRDQEREIREASTQPTWAGIKSTAAITRKPKRLRGCRWSSLVQEFNWMRGYSTGEVLKQAATTETLRRVTAGALAIERYRLRHGVYPELVQEAAPLAAMPLVDFMDGKPLRYRRLPDDRFLLYSVGLDGEDNGGTFRPWSPDSEVWPAPGFDILWPVPATKREVEISLSRDPERRRFHLLRSGTEIFPQGPP